MSEIEFLVIGGVALIAVIGLLVGFVSRGRRSETLEAPPVELEERTPESGMAVPEAPPRTAAPAAPAEAPDAPAPAPEVVEPAVVEPVEEITLAERFRKRLTRTRNRLGSSVADLFGRGVTDEAWEGLEEALIGADVGVEASLAIVEEVRRRAKDEGVTEVGGVVRLLKEELERTLAVGDRSLARASDGEPTVWLVTGVNGTGKTTSIGKIAAHEKSIGHQVVLAAADTFRAAAIDQLKLWAERSDVRLVAKEPGADPASVAYDGYMAAKATDADLYIVDTAGRLHNKSELMDELGKVKRVLSKQAGELEETLLVLDATTGQNGIAQARAFLDAVDVTGIILTKLDGTAKGGVVIAIQRELGLPVKLVGLGEGIDDLAEFDPHAFVEAIFADLAVA